MIQLTTTILIVVSILLGIYDIFAELKNPNATISVVLGKVALRNPIVPFMFGLLMGHWFWPQYGN